MMRYTLLNLIRSGVTTVMFNQSATARRMVWDEAQANLRAFAEAGVRTAFSLAFKNQCYLVYGNDEDVLGRMPEDLASGVRGIIDGSKLSTEDYLSMTADLIRDYPVNSTNMVRVLYSPQAYHWADEETLGRIAELGAGCGRRNSHARGGELLSAAVRGATARADAVCVASMRSDSSGPKTSIAHGVWLTADDMALMVETGTSISHNPSSNLRLRSGIAPVLELHQAGRPCRAWNGQYVDQRRRRPAPRDGAGNATTSPARAWCATSQRAPGVAHGDAWRRI